MWLVVKPVVSSDGYVNMDLAPEVSTLKGLINNQYPRTGITTVRTYVRAKDGDTVVIGGLLRELETLTLQKIAPRRPAGAGRVLPQHEHQP